MGIGAKEEFIRKLDGLLLGDGSLVSSSGYKKLHRTYSYNYNQRCVHREWIEKIGNSFNNEGIGYSIGHIPANIGKIADRYIHRRDSFIIQSHVSPVFNEEYKRWYKWYELDGDGRYIKTVPEDIKLNEECVANWYMGDGCIDVRSSNSSRINLCTDGFSKEEINLLSHLLEEELLIETTVAKYHKSYYRIRIGKNESVKKFLDYVRPYIIPCFNYKLPEVN